MQDVAGEALVVSQFTLYADARRGRRPSFVTAAGPVDGERLYEVFCEILGSLNVPVRQGSFGAHMEVELVNDGPFTVWLDSAELGIAPRGE
jgi:D-tyrosyl-tRNA(Tyr) deacylase